MLFNSLDFAVFLPIVFILYWYLAKGNLRFQNTLILIASYVFYGWWDWRFLLLIILSTIVDYLVGRQLNSQEDQFKRKLLLWTSITVNIGILGFFKYYNFFLENFVEAFSLFGIKFNPNTLNIVLPVGISFYTFQTLSYSIDVYNKKLTPTKDFIAFSAFVCFFPQLVAGPIEKASNLLPQLCRKRFFDYEKAVDGMRQILWGLFKKVVVADNCAVFVDLVFNNSSNLNGSSLVLGSILFTFQIYGDFSGYSDIAIGTSRLFGINLKQNFAFPYFSRDIAEFWRRWHISLSTWFRDYLYIPIGGSRGDTWMKLRNTLVVFLVSGFWHGANWTFIFWGGLNALYFIPLLLTNKNRKNLGLIAQGKKLPSIREFIAMLSTFALTVFAFIFFRSENLDHAFNFIGGIFSETILGELDFISGKRKKIELMFVCLSVLFLTIFEWVNRKYKHSLEYLKYGKQQKFIRYIIYFILFTLVIIFNGSSKKFIYFNF